MKCDNYTVDKIPIIESILHVFETSTGTNILENMTRSNFLGTHWWELILLAIFILPIFYLQHKMGKERRPQKHQQAPKQ